MTRRDTITNRVISMMQDFASRGRSETARWWAAVWGLGVTRVYRIAKDGQCEAALKLSARKGMNAPPSGVIPTGLIKWSPGIRQLRVGSPILRAAGMMDCETVAYAVDPGRIVLTRTNAGGKR